MSRALQIGVSVTNLWFVSALVQVGFFLEGSKPEITVFCAALSCPGLGALAVGLTLGLFRAPAPRSLSESIAVSGMHIGGTATASILAGAANPQIALDPGLAPILIWSHPAILVVTGLACAIVLSWVSRRLSKVD
jgi:hypothetical protein